MWVINIISYKYSYVLTKRCDHKIVILNERRLHYTQLSIWFYCIYRFLNLQMGFFDIMVSIIWDQFLRIKNKCYGSTCNQIIKSYINKKWIEKQNYFYKADMFNHRTPNNAKWTYDEKK